MFYVYRMSWKAPAGSFSALHQIFTNALNRLKARVNHTGAGNKRKTTRDVLRDTIVVKLRGVSSEVSLNAVPLPVAVGGNGEVTDLAVTDPEVTDPDNEDATVDNRLTITVLNEDGNVAEEHNVVVPLVRLEMGQDGKLKLYLRDSSVAEGRGVIASRVSMVIQKDGSCVGTDRARSLVPFLSAWNHEPAHVSRTLGRLLCYCIFCGNAMSKGSR